MSSTELVELVLAVIGIVVGIVGAWEEISSVFQTLLPNTPVYQIRKTTIKVLISEKQTEIIKLRTIRVFRKETTLKFSDAPSVLKQKDDYGEPPEVQDLYSLPGRAEITPDGKVLVVLEKDEVFSRFRDHTMVFGYTMTGGVDSLWDPPFIEAQAPVGSERLIIEVYFPPGWDIKRDLKHVPVKPKLSIRGSEEKLSELPNALSEIVTPPHHDFKDGRGAIQWIRAVIRRPPKRGEKSVVFEWEWKKTVPKVSSAVS